LKDVGRSAAGMPQHNPGKGECAQQDRGVDTRARFLNYEDEERVHEGVLGDPSEEP